MRGMHALRKANRLKLDADGCAEAAGQWRKREHPLLVANVDEVKSQLVESGERLLAQLSGSIADWNQSSSICSVVRSRRSCRSSCGLVNHAWQCSSAARRGR